MKTTLTYKAEIHADATTQQYIDNTMRYYEKLLARLIPIIEKEHDTLSRLSSNQQIPTIEALIHATKAHPNPKYPFDQEFPRCPSYLRRNAIRTAIGIYESYLTKHKTWETEGRSDGEPQLSYHHAKSPAFYRDNMLKEKEGSGLRSVKIKLYDGKAWAWRHISIDKTDARYIDAKRRHDGKLCCPTIKRSGKKTYLHFPMEYNTNLHDANIEDERICAIDLGINTDATCVIMESDGTVLDRKFIKRSSEKARLYHMIGRIRKAQSRGSVSCRRKWRRVNDLNSEIVKQVVSEIMEFAIKWSCTSIVCEFLSFSGKIRGSKKQRLHLWRKREVYRRLYDQAHVWGMRIHQVCAWNTSRLAFDGSGVVDRGPGIKDDSGESLGLSHSWVRFSTGKMFHADLNAAMNIGARFFVRELLKAFPVMGESLLKANVLGAVSGSTVVLSSLINLRRVLERGHVFESMPRSVVAGLRERAGFAVLGPCL